MWRVSTHNLGIKSIITSANLKNNKIEDKKLEQKKIVRIAGKPMLEIVDDQSESEMESSIFASEQDQLEDQPSGQESQS